VLLPGEVFLSHSARNRVFVNKISKVLHRYDVPYWYSKRHIRGAQQWHDEIGAALARCDWFVLVLSPAAVGSKWVKRELLYALQEDRYEGKIVPLLYKRCDSSELSWTLSSFQTVDFTGNFNDGCRDLLRIWGVTYVLPPTQKSVGSKKLR
jgi:hypothetical protein